jgi:Protein of unknown function (DUF3037)
VPTVWYSYAVVRVVPRVDREEFLNVGVILFAREQEFLAARIELDRQRLRSLAPDIDVELVERHLQTLQAISEGSGAGGPVAALPAPERFHWLVAPRSTMIQTSAVHVGRSENPRQALDELMRTLVRQAAAPAGPDLAG